MNAFRTFVAGTSLMLIATCSVAAGKLAVEREATVDGSPDTVWKLVGDFNGLDVWHPAVASSTMKGAGIKAGATRTLTLGNGAKIEEKLTAYSGVKHTYTYTILSSPLPVKNYVSTLTLSPAGEGKTRVKWSSTFDANGASDEEAKKVISGIYEGGLERAGSTLKK
ncbi:SRPBCC family protein [Methyloversatilis sp.]|jgi:mxaD protein|uniref:SRPBCC family protein n=1 Tax=Methyloversatilis sp. TaxID=2569862 RepID=UPI003F72C539